jgi:hypothetical protein
MSFFLATLALPALAQLREAEGRLHSANNMKQIALAMHNFHDVYKRMPLMAGKHGKGQSSWMFQLLPYLEQDFLSRTAEQDSWSIADTVVPILIDPRDTSAPGNRFQNVATTSYAGNWEIFNGKYKIHNIPDGSSNTLAFINRYQVCNGVPNAWAYSSLYTWAPMFGHYSTAMFQTNPPQDACDPHVGQAIGPIMLASLCDASVRSVSPGLSPLTWHRVIDPQDGQVLGNDW